MAGNNHWIPPVEFYFRVDFQKEGKQMFQASFLEISGLSQTIELKEMTQSGNDGVRIKLPEAVKCGNITLKRPLGPLSGSLVAWVNKCFSYTINGQIEPYDMIIKLLDKDGNPVAGWLCTHTFPIKWNLGGLDASKSGLALETLEMTCNRLKRIT